MPTLEARVSEQERQIMDLNHRVLRLEMELSLDRELAAQSAGEGEE